MFSLSISATADRTVIVNLPESFEEVYSILHTDQVHTEILYVLKGIKHIRRVPSEPGQLCLGQLRILPHALDRLSAANLDTVRCNAGVLRDIRLTTGKR